ncbi:putative 2OG-Fe(II) oxygenase [Synechococcus phage S-SZBM1]|uniref:2OG-Fe(II) oxygenase n=1 Tax=Synechococcus phage S-SZBM1 TaxID=2926475 RepID=A0AC61TSP2_9CAUD|nr:2OG-Fe(II) oxygenase [Synechococcus phage S-SZBM1]UNH61161.1 putative 2OG-Fe(II) oxygenase [Synechococcus phage S-SZBM1]
MNLDYIFPTPIWWVDLDIDIAKMQEICYGIAESMPSKSRSNRGQMNYQSPDFFGEEIIKGEDDDDEFAKLLKQIKQSANEAFDTFESQVTTLEFANVWVNINNNGGYNEIHTHPGSLMSGAFYVKTPSEDAGDPGRICFHRNAMEAYVIHSLGLAEDLSTAETPHTYATWTYPPKEGRLILFPSWIPHGVRENETNEDRISISFNLIPNRNKRDLHSIIKSHDRKGS